SDAVSRSSGASEACRNRCRAASVPRDQCGTCGYRRGLRYPWPLCEFKEAKAERQGRALPSAKDAMNRMNATAASSGPKSQPRVGLFVTCLVDIIRPSVGFASVKLLEDAGCKVVVPSQTCCGQPAYNAGDRSNARKLALQAIEAFEDCDYVVAPSGSCGGMLIKHYPKLFAGEPELAEWAERFAAKSHELISFLTDV